MTTARNEQMTVGAVETHHVWSRCVQQAFLCGTDRRTEEDYSHRREIVEAMILYQAQRLAIDLGSYSILENHLHLILKSRPEIVTSWSDEECAYRYKSAWPSWDGEQWICEPTDDAVRKLARDAERMEKVRERLGSISFFMGRVKQPLAWTFNRDPKRPRERRGCFWEKRFGNRRLESDAETLGCMLYCDLNQVRAGMAERLEDSHPTAIQKRILAEEARRAWIERHSEESWKRLQRELEQCDDPSREAYRQGVEALFQDCALSPITDRGPLATTEAIALQEDAKRTETDQAAGESLPRRPWQTQLTPRLILDPKPVNKNPETREEAEQRKNRERKRKIHKRMQRKLRLRKSDRCMVDISWPEYLRKANELARASVAERTEPTYSAEDDWCETPFSFHRQVKQFLHATYGALCSMLADRDSSRASSDASANPRSPKSRGQPPPSE